jgi:hypothetical protein
VEAVLVRGSLLTNSVSAGDSVAAQVAGSGGEDVMQFSSTQPRGNVVKAQNRVVFPKINEVKFHGGNGAIQSGGDVSVNATVTFNSQGDFSVTGAGTDLRNNTAGRDAASAQMQAKIRTGSPSNQNFSPDQLVAPQAGRRSIPAGTYTFVSADQVEFRNEAGQLADPGLSGKVELRDFRFIPLGDIEVPGNLTLNGMVPRSTWVGAPGPPHFTTSAPEPTVISLGIGYNTNGIPKDAQDPKDRLTVNGDLKVTGDLTGNGQLFVQKNHGQGGNLHVMGNSFMSSTRTDGMAVVAEGTAKFSEVDTDAAALPVYMAPNDFSGFSQALLSEYNHPSSAAVFNRFHQSTTTERMGMLGDPGQAGDAGLRNQPVGDGLPKPLTSYGGVPLHQLNLSIYDPSGGNATLDISARDLVSQYIDNQTHDAGGNARALTLGGYLRLREFLKSVDLGAPKAELLDPNHPHYGEGEEMVVASILNQVQAYDQDARNEGRNLRDYLDHLLTNSINPYQVSVQELIFGGLLYAEGNLFTAINNSFNLYGAMIAKGNIGFAHLQKGRFVFDPSVVEEQFELSKLGLVPAFFWTE